MTMVSKLRGLFGPPHPENESKADPRDPQQVYRGKDAEGNAKLHFVSDSQQVTIVGCTEKYDQYEQYIGREYEFSQALPSVSPEDTAAERRSAVEQFEAWELDQKMPQVRVDTAVYHPWMPIGGKLNDDLARDGADHSYLVNPKGVHEIDTVGASGASASLHDHRVIVEDARSRRERDAHLREIKVLQDREAGREIKLVKPAESQEQIRARMAEMVSDNDRARSRSAASRAQKPRPMLKQLEDDSLEFG